MAKGQKTCKSCGHQTGPRTIICQQCSYVFLPDKVKPETAPSEPKKRGRKRKLRFNKRGEKCDWRSLQKRDRIRVLGGGPYWPMPDGSKETIGYKGVFTVINLDSKGISVFPVGKTKESGLCYIYMGPRTPSPTGLIRRAHRIRKIDQPTAEALYVA